MGWLQAILSIIDAAPQLVQIIEGIINSINSNPSGVSAGVDAVGAHMAKMPKP